MPQASRTAEYMALFRALESARGRNVRLFTDPWAKRFLNPTFRIAAVLAQFPLINSALSRFIDWRWPGARTSGVARTRYIDEAVTGVIDEGLSQIVILGAGFDSRAYRIPGVAKSHVFEVDHPDTSRTKQNYLRKSLGRLPGHVSYVSIDFNRQPAAEVMRNAGLDLNRPTFFLWEGVTNYLTEHAVDTTLRYVATAAAHSRILFTYIHRDVLRAGSTFFASDSVRTTVRDIGEPWTFGFDPAELPHYLQARGLRLLSDVDSRTYRAQYMGLRGRHLRGYEFYRIALAEVPDRSAPPFPAAHASLASQRDRHAQS